MQLFETIVFKKPPNSIDKFVWHNDVSFFPLDPPNHISVWIALDECNKETGKLEFAKKSHFDLYNDEPVNLKGDKSHSSYFSKILKIIKYFHRICIRGCAFLVGTLGIVASQISQKKNQERVCVYVF